MEIKVAKAKTIRNVADGNFTCRLQIPWGAHSQILSATQSTCATGLQYSQTIGKHSLDSKPTHVKY